MKTFSSQSDTWLRSTTLAALFLTFCITVSLFTCYPQVRLGSVTAWNAHSPRPVSTSGQSCLAHRYESNHTVPPRSSPSSFAGTSGSSDTPMVSLLGLSQASCWQNSWISSLDQRCTTRLMCCTGLNGLHNVSLLESDDLSDCPPVSPLSITRCLPELWVITHLGINLRAWPMM